LAAAPILVLSPHADDAVFGCWSALDQGDREVVVVNVFAGLPPPGTSGGWDRECGVPDSVEMMKRRRMEDERALARVDVTPVHLDFLDMQYTAEDRDIEAIAAGVKTAVSGWSELYAPAAAGGYTKLLGAQGLTLAPHPDHEAVREAAGALARPGIPTYFYAEIPYASGDARGRTWPHGLTDFTPVLEAGVGGAVRPLIHEHSDESLARRREAVAQYTTQVARLEEGVGPFASDDAVLRYEVLWCLSSADRARGSRPPMRRR
jgi:LmbE family N-acetylglucosaminyl deacetylase